MEEEKRDWNCPACKGVNFARRVKCFKCHADRPGYEGQVKAKPDNRETSKPGDWVCRYCKGNNFARRVTCYECGTYKPNPRPKPRSGVQRKEGDWECASCSTLNFSYRVVCLSCKKPKDSAATEATKETSVGGETEEKEPDAEKAASNEAEQEGEQEGEAEAGEETHAREARAPPQMLDGDWICSDCKELNFARRVVCFGCSAPKNRYPGRSGRGRGSRGRGGRGRGDRRPDDWVCGDCHVHNFAFREQCFSCHAPRSAKRSSSPSIKPGDWTCPSCKTFNFARRTQCMECALPKE